MRRGAALAQATGQSSASLALHRARRAFASAERQVQLDAAFELRTAEHVVEVLGNMKGALMKLGQMASYLDTGLPEQFREVLTRLQQDAPPMSSDLAASTIEKELGGAPDSLFLEWDPEPIASASIGQVHRAITHDGHAVAVKLQYPGVDAAIRADLGNAGILFGTLGMMFPGLDPGPLVTEIRERVVEELDYVLEAHNQQLFADFYRGHPFIHIPAVLPHLSTSRVLTTELAEGVRFDDTRNWTQDERDLAGEAIYRFVFRSFYHLHAFNGDPHPGNYIFRPSGQVSFLDFGLVKRFTTSEIDLFGRMTRAMAVDHNLPAYRAIVEEAGLLKPGLEIPDNQVRDFFGHFYEFVMTDEAVTVTPEWSLQTMQRFLPRGAYDEVVKAANLPPTFVILQRINLGLMAILGDLHTTANFRGIAEELWPWTNRAPTTDLGADEAAWIERRRLVREPVSRR